MVRLSDRKSSWDAYAAAVTHSALFLRPSGVAAVKALLATCLKFVAADLGIGVKAKEESDSG